MCCSDPDADVLARADADVQVATIWRPCDVTNNIMVISIKRGQRQGTAWFCCSQGEQPKAASILESSYRPVKTEYVWYYYVLLWYL